MLQHIDLRPKEEKISESKSFNAEHVWLCSFLLTLVLVGHIVWSHMDYKKLLVLAEKSETDYGRLMAQYSQISDKLSDALGDEEIEVAVQRLSGRVAEQKGLLVLFKQRMEQEVPFSKLVSLLTEYDKSGVKVEQIAFVQGAEEILVEGYVRSSRELGGFLLYLNSVSQFDGRKFSLIALGERVNDQIGHPFKLSSYSDEQSSAAQVRQRQRRSVGGVAAELDRRLTY